jgi:hypothetical protein
MKKLSIQTLSISVNNDKINIVYLENKNEKYILYSATDETNIDNNVFSKMEFPVNIQITPKKKMTDLKLNVNFNKNNNNYYLLFNNHHVYFTKNSKNITVNYPNLKLILQNGQLYDSQPKQIITPVKDIVNEILSKNKRNIPEELEIKNIEVNTDNENEFNITKIVNSNQENNNIKEINYKTLQKQNVYNEVLEEVVASKEVLEEEVASKEVLEEEVASKKVLEEVVASKEVLEEVVASKEVLEEVVASKEVLEKAVISKEVLEEDVASKEVLEEDVASKEVLEKAVISKEVVEEVVEKKEVSNEEKKDNIIKLENSLEKEVFNLENILVDFNKLFQFIKKDEPENNIKSSEKKENVENIKISNNINNKVTKTINDTNAVNNANVVNNNSTISNAKNNDKLNTLKIMNKEVIVPKEDKIFSLKINYQNIIYKINVLKLEESPNLNMLNLYNHKIPEANFINKTNLSFQLENNNSSYLLLFMNQKILINKINNNIVFTNLINKNSQILKNKDNFKIGNYDFLIYNDCTLIIPVTNQKIFDNNYGTSYNLYIPKI